MATLPKIIEDYKIQLEFGGISGFSLFVENSQFGEYKFKANLYGGIPCYCNQYHLKGILVFIIVDVYNNKQRDLKTFNKEYPEISSKSNFDKLMELGLFEVKSIFCSFDTVKTDIEFQNGKKFTNTTYISYADIHEEKPKLSIVK
jgi:hypothetical protein